MIQFMNVSRRKANLVSIGTVAIGSGDRQPALREFSLHGFLYRFQRISCTGNTHCLIDIRPSAERITNRSA